MRFIHIADVHLGAKPDRRAAWGQQREEEIWQSFEQLLMRVKKEQADLLLIAGDLFHSQPLMRDLKEVNYLFEKLGDIQVVLIMGNHDYIKRDSAILSFEWAENVTCLTGSTLEYVRFPKLSTVVYGFSYHDYEIKEPLYDSLHPNREEGCHILLAHGGDMDHIPMDKRRLAASDFTYIALGHIHKPEILVNNKMAYAGALEPIDCNDTGAHGYIRGEYRDGKVMIEFVPFASREYIHLKIESNPQMTAVAMREKIQQEIESLGSENLYQIMLTGYRDMDMNYPVKSYEGLGNILEVQDRTEVYLELEQLKLEHKDDICGRFIEKLYDEKNQMSVIRRKALAYGVQALLEE